MNSKRGVMAWDEILGVMLAAGAVLILVILMFKLLAPGVDVNKEYAEGVFEKLEKAAAEAKDGVGEFSILDVPVDYADSVFLVLFKGEDHILLSNYTVEIKNSGFMTYVKRSAAGPILSESGLGYYPLFREAGVDPGVAREANEKIVKEVSELTVETMDDILFQSDMREVVRHFVTKTGGTLDADKIIQEMLDTGVGKGLAPAKKMDALASALTKYTPASGKVGTYTDMDNFMKTAKALAHTHTQNVLKSEVAFNVEAEKVIRNVGGDNADNMIKEMTDKTFAEGLSFEDKMDELKKILKESVDDVDVDVAVKGVKKGRTAKEALKTALSSADDVSDDAVKMVTDNILSVKAIPADDAVEGIIRNNLDEVGETVLKRVLSASRGRLTGLTFKVAGKIAGAVFVIWEAKEYYQIAHTTQAWLLTALNQDDVVTNEWVSQKLLHTKKGDGDMLCVCYVDDDYKRNICSDCVDFKGKQITPRIEGENYWTFCEDIVLEDMGGGVLLSSFPKMDCKLSIALTNVECEESRTALANELNELEDKVAGATASIASGGGYGLVMGAIGGFIGGAIGAIGGAGAGAVPGAVLGAKWGVAIGLAMGAYAGYEGVDFSCDGQGHIYLGAVPE